MSYIGRVRLALDGVNIDAVNALVVSLIGLYTRRGYLYVAGNGGSASTASHFVTDIGVGSQSRGGGLRAVCLSSNNGVVTATANDEGFGAVFARQVELLANVADVLVLISASGDSPNLVEAAKVGKRLGVEVVALTAFTGGALSALADLSIHVPTAVGDYGPAEDAHLTICHMVTELFRSRLRALNVETPHG